MSFDLDHGNYVLKYFIDKEVRSEALDAFHRVNTGWTMWKKAIQIKQEDLNELKCLPEGCVVVSIEQAKDSERLEFLLNNPTLETSILTRESCVGIMSRFLLVYEVINKFINKKSAKPLRYAIDKAMHEHNQIKNID